MQIALIPHRLMQHLYQSDRDAVHINVLFSCILLVAIFSWPSGLGFITSLPHFCLFEYLFGLPCPGCDITAALAALAHLEIQRSLLIQPCGVVLVSTVFIQSTIRGAYLLRLINFQRTDQIVSALNLAFITLLITFWVFRRPAEPEEVAMFIILANLQNLLEHESETLIEHYATLHGNAKEQQFAASFSEGFVSFRCKFDWLLARALITQDQWDTMEEIRRLRNDHIHARPSSVRCRHTYRGFPLLTQRSVRRMFVEVELVLRTLREKSGQQVKWPTVPPGFASELHWPTEYVQALETN